MGDQDCWGGVSVLSGVSIVAKVGLWPLARQECLVAAGKSNDWHYQTF